MVSETDELRYSRGRLACGTLLVLLAAGCGSASQSVTGPSGTKCAVTATADTASFPPAGGNGQLSVSANRECTWAASTPNAWIQLSGVATGQGEARLPFSVGANGDPTTRQGAISVGDQQVSITQQAAPCQFSLEPPQATIPPGGGRGTIRLTASSSLCTWTARSEAGWLAILEGAQGTGTGQIVYEAAATSGPPRNGSLTIAGLSAIVTQGDGCSTSLNPAAQTVGAGGGSSVVSVAAGDGCAWIAASAAPWITISAGATGSGPGEVRLSVAANTGPERSGTVAIDGQPFIVTQASGCAISVTPASQAFPSAGGSGSIAVTAGAGCSWTASSPAPWITVTSGTAGSGPGEVRFGVAASTGPERSSTVSVGNRTFAVTQASGCRVSLDPTSGDFASGGGTGTVKVTVGDGCPWTASASEPWVQITAGGSGAGPGAVTFAVAAHDGPARQASLTIGGQPSAIQQESGCTFTLSAPGAAYGPGGGGGTVVVQTADGCGWTASSSEPWIQISAGQAGTGTGPVHFVVAPNSGPERSAAIIAGGQPFFVRQTGP